MKQIFRQIFRAEFGSRLYGTSLPESDHDYRAVAFMPKLAYLGLTQHPTWTQSIQNGQDVAGVWLHVFVKNVLGGAPETLELLFAPKLDVDPAWTRIEPFLKAAISQKVYVSFGAASEKYFRDAIRGGLGEEVSRKAGAAALRYLVEAEQLLRVGRIEFPVVAANYMVEIRRGLVRVEDFREEYERRRQFFFNSLNVTVLDDPLSAEHSKSKYDLLDVVADETMKYLNEA